MVVLWDSASALGEGARSGVREGCQRDNDNNNTRDETRCPQLWGESLFSRRSGRAAASRLTLPQEAGVRFAAHPVSHQPHSRPLHPQASFRALPARSRLARALSPPLGAQMREPCWRPRLETGERAGLGGTERLRPLLHAVGSRAGGDMSRTSAGPGVKDRWRAEACWSSRAACDPA